MVVVCSGGEGADVGSIFFFLTVNTDFTCFAHKSKMPLNSERPGLFFWCGLLLLLGAEGASSSSEEEDGAMVYEFRVNEKRGKNFVVRRRGVSILNV